LRFDAGFLKNYLHVVLDRLKLIAFLNGLFFSCVALVAVVTNYVMTPPEYMGTVESSLLNSFQGNWFLMFMWIFAFNLVLSAFVVVTLPGVVFFPLSAAMLLYRAVFWGVFVYTLPLGSFFMTLPTLVVEGEAYVLAATAGILAGVSWTKPDLLYPAITFSRRAAVRRGLADGIRIYGLVTVLLLLAAAVETATIILQFPMG